MGRVQRWAEGFLSLIGNKVGGREPTTLSDVVMPTVDMTQLFLGRTLSSQTAISAGASAVGDTVTFTVPDGKIWLLAQVGSIVATNALTDLHVIRAQLQRTNGDPQTTSFILGQTQWADAGAVAARWVTTCQNFPAPFVLSAGVEIVFEVADSNQNFRTWSATVSFYELDA